VTDPVVPADRPPRVDPVKSERVEVARGSDGRPVLLPRGVIVATAWTWRLLLIGLGLYVLTFLVLARTQVVTTPLLIAVLITALLYPLHKALRRLRVPRILSAVMCVLALIGLVGGAFYLVGQQVAAGVQDAFEQAQVGVDQVIGQVATLLGVEESQVDDWLDQAVGQVQDAAGQLGAGALAATSTVATVATGAVLALFATIFFLADGPRIWRFLTRLFPHEGRAAVEIGGKRAWGTLGTYVRTLPVIAAADAVGIGLGVWLLGVPFPLAIAVLTFFTAFVPVIGAVFAGAVAVLIALVSNGFVTALLVLGVVVAVQQIESNLLQPVLMGRALELHPLAVVTATSIGLLLAGIVGGVLAVPMLAAAITMIASVRHGDAARQARARAAVTGATPAEKTTDEGSVGRASPGSGDAERE
jgi:predicted PurR-regulated permease PerM